MCCRQNTVNLTTTTKQLLCHPNMSQVTEWEKRRRPVFSLCVLGQVCLFYLFGLYDLK